MRGHLQGGYQEDTSLINHDSWGLYLWYTDCSQLSQLVSSPPQLLMFMESWRRLLVNLLTLCASWALYAALHEAFSSL